LGEVEYRSSRAKGDGGRPAASVKSATAAVARVCAREREREKEREKPRRKKMAQDLSMN
jgi:hypothetical protein